MDTIRTIACKLAPTDEQRKEMEATLVAFADACNSIAQVARQIESSNKVIVQHACYYEVRQRFGLSSNLAIRAIARVCAALKVSAKAHSTFAPTSIDYDQRIFSFREGDWTLSLTVLHSRARLATAPGDYQKVQLQGRLPGSAALVKRRDGTFFLHVVLVESAPDPGEPANMIGVDLGVTNLATTDDGENFSGDGVEACRKLSGGRQEKTYNKKKAYAVARPLQRMIRPSAAAPLHIQKELPPAVPWEATLAEWHLTSQEVWVCGELLVPQSHQQGRSRVLFLSSSADRPQVC